MKIGDRIFVRGYIDEIRKDTVIVRNDGGYFGTIPSEVITGELPSAQPEKRTEKRTETHACDLIDREAAVDAIYHHFPSVSRTRARTMLHELPSAQPEIKPIDYQDCANAMMKMWMDNVLTGGEYNRIMDKLNKHEMERRKADERSDL